MVARRAQLSRTRPDAAQATLFGCVNGRGRGTGGIRGQRAALDGRSLARPTHGWALLCSMPGGGAPLIQQGVVGLGPCVVVGEFDADLAGVLALAVEAVPVVARAATGGDDGLKVDPGLANQLRLLVVVEDGHLEAVVVRRVVDGEAQLLVPGRVSMHTPCNAVVGNAHHLGVWPPRLSVLVFLASLPRRAAAYGSCLPMVRLLGRLRARSMMTTSVPMTGPSTVMSEKMPAVCAPLPNAEMLTAMAASRPGGVGRREGGR